MLINSSLNSSQGARLYFLIRTFAIDKKSILKRYKLKKLYSAFRKAGFNYVSIIIKLADNNII